MKPEPDYVLVVVRQYTDVLRSAPEPPDYYRLYAHEKVPHDLHGLFEPMGPWVPSAVMFVPRESGVPSLYITWQVPLRLDREARLTDKGASQLRISMPWLLEGT